MRNNTSSQNSILVINSEPYKIRTWAKQKDKIKSWMESKEGREETHREKEWKGDRIEIFSEIWWIY